MNSFTARLLANWKTTLSGLLIAAIAIAHALQQAGHDPLAIIVATGTALLGVLAKD